MCQEQRLLHELDSSRGGKMLFETTAHENFVERVKKYGLLFCFLVVRPSVSLLSGPLHAIEGSDVTLPTCHVTGHPTPVLTWSKSFGQLPHGRVQYNNSVIKLLDVRKADSDNYICTARNLLGNVVKRTVLVVVSLPQFTVKLPLEVVAFISDTKRC